MKLSELCSISIEYVCFEQLQDPGEPPKPGHVYDSNRVLLLSALKEYGFVAKDMGIAKDR